MAKFLEINDQIYFTINEETRILPKCRLSLEIKDLLVNNSDHPCLYSIHHLLYYFKMKNYLSLNLPFTLEGEPIVYIPIDFVDAIFIYNGKQLHPKQINYSDHGMAFCDSGHDYKFMFKVSLPIFNYNNFNVYVTQYNPISLYKDRQEKIVFRKCPIFNFSKKEVN